MMESDGHLNESNIPEDVMKAARECANSAVERPYNVKSTERAAQTIARALQAERDRNAERLREATELLNQLHHAVCGENGFANSVRFDSCRAYPWPALDIADKKARAFLAKEGK